MGDNKLQVTTGQNMLTSSRTTGVGNYIETTGGGDNKLQTTGVNTLQSSRTNDTGNDIYASGSGGRNIIRCLADGYADIQVGSSKIKVENTTTTLTNANINIVGDTNVSGNLRITNAGGLNINSLTVDSLGDRAFVNLFESNDNWGHQISNDAGDDAFRITKYQSGTNYERIKIVGNGDAGKITMSGDLLIESETVNPKLTLWSKNVTDTDPTIDLLRNSGTFGADIYYDWRMTNDGGTFKIQTQGTITGYTGLRTMLEIGATNAGLTVNGDLTVSIPNEIYYKGETLDTRFHSLDNAYYTETESDARFVNVTGDTMSGNLIVDGTSKSNEIWVGADTYQIEDIGIYFTRGRTRGITDRHHYITTRFDGISNRDW